VAQNMFVAPSISIGGRRRYSVPLSIAAHTAVIIAAIIVPLLATNSGILPTPPAMLAFVGTPPLPSAPPPPSPPRTTTEQPRPATNADAAPINAPHEIAPETPSQPNRSLISAIEGAGAGEIPGGVGEHTAPPPPPPVTLRAPRPVGGDIRPPAKVRDVRPAYPRIAQAARVQGLVIIEATIGPDGKVRDAKVLRSIPLLDAAALEAVRQWEYTPTLLNGVPVPIVMTITVQFTLQ
jgi:protein TonB